MSAIPIQRPVFSRNFSYGIRFRHKVSSFWTIVNSRSTPASTEKQSSPELQKVSIPDKFGAMNIQFGRLQQADQGGMDVLGQFVAREAQLDEEYWTAAWLRAEAHSEDGKYGRYADNCKRKFAEQIKREDETVKRTILRSVVGTLDLSIGYLSHGQRFLGELVKAPPFCLVDRKSSIKYGYIANLCVAKSARRKGIARNMLQFSISCARKQGAERVFVHVHRSNKPAQCLYEQMGFKVVEAANPSLSRDRICLLSFETIFDDQASFTDYNV